MISLLVATARTKSRLNDVKFVQQALLALFFDKETRFFAFSSELLNRDESTLRLDPRHFIFMATAKGTVKKTAATQFARQRSVGLRAIELDEDDVLIGTAVTDGNSDIMLFSYEY